MGKNITMQHGEANTHICLTALCFEHDELSCIVVIAVIAVASFASFVRCFKLLAAKPQFHFNVNIA